MCTSARDDLRVAARKLLLAGVLLTAFAITACSGGEDAAGTGDQPSTGNEPSASSTRTPTSTPPPTEVPQHALLSVAPDFTLPNANGSPITLSELSSEKPVVLVFYRAFW